MGTINVGIIGCGRIADLHYPGYANNRHARIYAVCDAVENTARRRMQEWQAEKMFTDYRELFPSFALAALGLLMAEMLLHNTLFRRSP